jgi:hypothetical protein
MSDFSSACLTLMLFLLSLDCTQFYPSMNHAVKPQTLLLSSECGTYVIAKARFYLRV